MEACCVAQVGYVQIVSELSAGQLESKADEGTEDDIDTLSRPLQPVTCEEQLPPVHGQRSWRSQKPAEPAGSEFHLLPSVGTWLMPLPCKLAPRPVFEIDERLLRPSSPRRGEVQESAGIVKVVQAEMSTGYYANSWTACEIHLHHDRLSLVTFQKASDPQVLLEHWLSEPIAVSGRMVFLGEIQVQCQCGEEALLATAAKSASTRLVSQLRDRRWSFVHLNVYDLFNWQMSIFNRVTWLLGAGGAYHAGLELYGTEYAFGGAEIGINGSGITTCMPKSCRKHSFSESICLGATTLSAEEVGDLIIELAPDWSTQDYEILGPNCITFCRHMCSRLGVSDVPDWVDSMARSIKERRVISDPRDGLAGLNGGCCPKQHLCRLQSQGFLAGFVEVVACSACECDIETGLEHWHCSECDENYCVSCLSPAVT